MPHGESISYSEGSEKNPISVHGLEPYEIKEVDGEFIAYLPVAGTKDSKGKMKASLYGEISYSSEEEAYKAVAEARKDLGVNVLN